MLYYSMIRTQRYLVRSQDMDGITAWFVLDTHHPYYRSFPMDYASECCLGLSMNRLETIELAELMNQEHTQ